MDDGNAAGAYKIFLLDIIGFRPDFNEFQKLKNHQKEKIVTVKYLI